VASGSVIEYPGKRGTVYRIKFKDAGGKQVMRTIGSDRREAERALRHALTDVEREGFRQPDTLKFREFANRWIEEQLPARQLKPSAREGHETITNRHLIPFLGDYTLAELDQRPELLDRYIAAKAKQGLSAQTIRNTLVTLNVMLKQAVRWRLIRVNPVTAAERPRVEHTEMNVLTEAEIAALLAAYAELERPMVTRDDHWWGIARAITIVALGTGFRRGELLGLRWGDVEMLAGRVHVRQTLVRGRMTTPKSRASRRTIEIGPRTLTALQEHYKASRYTSEDSLVFCHPQLGTPLDPSKLSRDYMRPALKKAGIIKPFRPWHDLRHTALTHEAAAGNPAVYVQMKAGHASGAITDRYIHAAQVLFPGAAAKGEERIFSEATG
jgi:integrase